MKRTVAGILLGLALSIGGFFIASGSAEGSVQVVRIWPIAAGIVAMLLAWLLQGTTLALLARPQIGRFRPLSFTRVYLASQAVGAATPLGGMEIPYQLLKYEELDVPGAWGGAMLTVKSILNGSLLVGGGVVAVLFFSGVPQINNWMLVGAFAGIALAWVIVAFLVNRGGGRSGNRSRGEKRGWRQKLREFLLRLRGDLSELMSQDRRLVGLGVLCMVLYWAVYPTLGVFGLLAAGWSGENLLAVFGAQFVLYFVIPFSPTPGNSGAAEVLFAALMSSYVPHAAVLGGLLIWRALNHYSELVIGAFFAGRDAREDIELAREHFGSG